MARPKKLSIGGSHAVEKDESEVRWLISYSDFMMQLVCLFILLYSVSSLDKGKMALVAAYYRASIGLGQPPIQEPPSKGRNLAVGDRPLVGAPQGRVDVPPDVQYKVEAVPGGWMVRFDDAVFASGSAELTPRLRSDLDVLVAHYRAYAGTVFVTGTAGPAPDDATGEGGVVMRLAQEQAQAVVSHVTREGLAGAFDVRFLQAAGRMVPAAQARRVEIFVRVK